MPEALEHVVSRCLEKDPADRFQTPQDLTAALERAAPQLKRPQRRQQDASARPQAPQREPSRPRAPVARPADGARPAGPPPPASPRAAPRRSRLRRFVIGAAFAALAALIAAAVLSDVLVRPPSEEAPPATEPSVIKVPVEMKEAETPAVAERSRLPRVVAEEAATVRKVVSKQPDKPTPLPIATKGVNVRQVERPQAAVAAGDTPSSRSILAASYNAMNRAESFQFEGLGEGQFLTDTGGIEKMDWDFVGEFLAPDRSHGVLRESTSDLDQGIAIVTIGGTTYVRVGERGEWRIESEQSVPVPHVTLDIGPFVTQDLVYAGQETFDGVPIHHLEGTLPMQVLSPSESEEQDGRLQVEYWIEVDSSLLRALNFSGATGDGQRGTFSWTIKYFDFGTPVVIERPEIVPERVLVSADEVISLSNSDLRISGDIELSVSPIKVSLENSSVTRSNQVLLSDEDGAPVPRVSVTISEGRDARIELGPIGEALTDDEGQAVIALDYSDEDSSKQHRLSATVDGQVVGETLNSSPVPMSTPRSAAVVSSLSDPVSDQAQDCYSKRSDKDTVKLISIHPASGVRLQAGVSLDFKADVQYRLDSHGNGRVTLWYLLPPTDEDRYSGGWAVLADTSVSRGRGVVAVQAAFEVMDRDQLEIKLNLQPPKSAVRRSGLECWASIVSGPAWEYPVFSALPSGPSGPNILTTEPVAGPSLVETAGIDVKAHVDGRSLLVIRGRSAQWFHLGAAAPGRHDLVMFDTFINEAPWAPEWPDRPDIENRDCRCASSLFESAEPLLPGDDIFVGLEIAQARGDVLILEQPTERNDYTLIVEFDDNGPGGSDWYEVRIVPASSSPSSGRS